MNRIDIIQALITKIDAQNYLEVGVQAGHCFNAINCKTKVGVDPDPASAATSIQTSDDFFVNYKALLLEGSVQKFDVCFSDGLHHAEQSYRDILNMLDCLNENGFIVCHDMLPTSKHMQEIPQTDQNEWTGDVWRSWVRLRAERDDLEFYCINTDWGTSVIKRGKQEKLKINKPLSELTYEDFEANKQEWMNIISVEEFKQKFL